MSDIQIELVHRSSRQRERQRLIEVLPEAAASLGQALLQTGYRVPDKITGALLQIMHRAPLVSFICLFQQIN
ncbi:hypothetical protein CUC53_16790 [Aeromonas cavernicola]|uniref:Uncharacterized protein n=1 Tax=Aeromonas cavernicola TaxID=1006623 RepID=A0A2H9U0S6_9GAMM|nr:hypothetical protein CUC53_16790 [Aeromonas cavernicola]